MILATVTCPKCGHSWTPRTASPRLSCSQCSHTFKRSAPDNRLLGRLPGAEPCTICGHQGLDYNVCRIDGDLSIVCDGCLRELEK